MSTATSNSTPGPASPSRWRRKFGDDKGGNLTTLLAYNGFFALLPLLLVLVTLLGYLLGHHPTMEQQVLPSALAEFPILGTQLEQNIHALRANGIGLAIGIAGSLWGAGASPRPASTPWPSYGTFPARTGPASGPASSAAWPCCWCSPSAWPPPPCSPGWAAWAATPPAFGWPIWSWPPPSTSACTCWASGSSPPARSHPAAGGRRDRGWVAWQALLAVGGYLVGHNLKHASEVYGFFAVVLGLLSWLYLGAQLTLYAAEVNVVRARRLWPRSLLQPPLTQPDQRALVDLAKQEERRPEQSVEVTFTPNQNPGSPTGPSTPSANP